jgi:hypothetical protein
MAYLYCQYFVELSIYQSGNQQISDICGTSKISKISEISEIIARVGLRATPRGWPGIGVELTGNGIYR